MSVSFSTAEIQQKYEGFASRYDLFEGALESLGVGRLRHRLLRRASGRVLEVAAGTGKGFPSYSKSCRVIAVDLSPAMLRIARRRADRHGVGIGFGVADAKALPFPDQSFDSVVSCLSLCTFPDPGLTLREMDRVSRSEGMIFLMEHGRSDRDRLSRWQDRKADGHAEFLGCHWNREPLDLVRQAGMRPVAVRRLFFGIFHVIEARSSRKDRGQIKK